MTPKLSELLASVAWMEAIDSLKLTALQNTKNVEKNPILASFTHFFDIFLVYSFCDYSFSAYASPPQRLDFSNFHNCWGSSKSPSFFIRCLNLLSVSKNSAILMIQIGVGGLPTWRRFSGCVLFMCFHFFRHILVNNNFGLYFIFCTVTFFGQHTLFLNWLFWVYFQSFTSFHFIGWVCLRRKPEDRRLLRAIWWKKITT